VEEFDALKDRGQNEFTGLESFPLDEEIMSITMNSDEFTAVCPITGQPDLYKVTITFMPMEKGIESKSLKLYLGTFRNEGAFCEALAARICRDFAAASECYHVQVMLEQKSRGGISIEAVATMSQVDVEIEVKEGT